MLPYNKLYFGKNPKIQFKSSFGCKKETLPKVASQRFGVMLSHNPEVRNIAWSAAIQLNEAFHQMFRGFFLTSFNSTKYLHLFTVFLGYMVWISH